MADEPKVGPNRGNAGKGRPKGSPNKTTAAAKATIEFAAERLGGGQRLVEWAQEDPDNEKAFWTSIYPRLLPLKHEGAGDNGAHIIQVLTGVPRAGD